MNAYISDGNRRLKWNGRDHDPRPGQPCEIDVHLRYRRAGHADADGVAAGVAGIRLYCKLVIVWRRGVVVEVDDRRILMIVSGRTMVMIRMIVRLILVYVQRRAHGA